MEQNQNSNPDQQELILVIGGTGKTGRRVAARLEERGIPVRIGSRSAVPAFDWTREESWGAALEGVTAAYITLAPDLAVPGSTDLIQAFCDRAKQAGVERLVLLSGRGEPEAQACERIVQQSGMASTIVRSSWFNQNFSEGAFIEMVLAGAITLPVSDVREPFIDLDDLADVAVAALTEPGHTGEVYEVTGPRLMTFADIADDLSKATSREISFVSIPHDAFLDGVAKSGAPKEVIWIMDYLFTSVLDGRNAHLSDGVQRALGREPKDFAEYAREVAGAGVWGNTA